MLSAKTQKNIIRYVDELTSRMELEGVDRKEFEEEMIENIKASVEGIIAEGYSEEEALKKAFERFGDDEVVKDYNPNVHAKKSQSSPAELFSTIMGLVIGLVVVYIFVPSPIKIIPILGIIAGGGFRLINAYTERNK